MSTLKLRNRQYDRPSPYPYLELANDLVQQFKKPIYDEHPPEKPTSRPLPSPAVSTPSTSSPEPIMPTPTSTVTDRLAHQIRRSRLFLYDRAVVVEDKLNQLMSSFFDLETSFTNTIAGLAPPKESGEQLMPGVIYVLVAAMAGSITTRSRNIFIRATFPAAVGIGASWLLLPITTRNVADLVWRYEQRVPRIRENHLLLRQAFDDAWTKADKTSDKLVRTIDETVHRGREKLEEWVKKGR